MIFIQGNAFQNVLSKISPVYTKPLLDQCWLLIGKVLWHSLVAISQWLPSLLHAFSSVSVKIAHLKLLQHLLGTSKLMHWGRVTHKCVSKLAIIASDNSLPPGRRQAIIWTNDGILLIRPLETNFSEISIEIRIFSFKKMHLKMSGNWRSFCLGLNVLTLNMRGPSYLSWTRSISWLLAFILSWPQCVNP